MFLPFKISGKHFRPLPPDAHYYTSIPTAEFNIQCVNIYSYHYAGGVQGRSGYY